MLKNRKKIQAPPLSLGSPDVVTLIDTYFNAYNAARLRESCQLFAHMIERNAFIGVSLSGALTPAGLSSVITPLMEHGFIDYIASTGANLYHDLHFDLGFDAFRGDVDMASGRYDVLLREETIFRVYDVLFDGNVLYETDDWLYKVLSAPEFQQRMGTAELHYKIGKYASAMAQKTHVKPSILATAYAQGIPIWSPSPGDSTIGLNIAALQVHQSSQHPCGPHVDPSIDVNDMAALIHHAKIIQQSLSGVVIFGGGSPKNFVLQTEPQLQEILGFEEKGHDFFVQITDARPDTGGLSGATASESVSWGKVDPERLSHCVTAYLDATIALPLMASYVLEKCKPRKIRRLYDQRESFMETLSTQYRASDKFKKICNNN